MDVRNPNMLESRGSPKTELEIGISIIKIKNINLVIEKIDIFVTE